MSIITLKDKRDKKLIGAYLKLVESGMRAEKAIRQARRDAKSAKSSNAARKKSN